MRQTLLSLPALFASLVLLVAGGAMLGTLLSLRLASEVPDPRVISVVLACYAVGFVLGTLYCPLVMMRVGHIRTFAAFAALAAIAVLLHPLYFSVPLWAALRGLTGFSIAGLMTVLEAWLNTRANRVTRARLMSVYMVCFFLASSLGQLMIGIGRPTGFQLFNVVAVLVVASLIPLALTRAEAPVLARVSRLPIRRLYSFSPSGLAGALVSGVVIGAFLTMGPVFAVRSGLSVDQVSVYMALSVLAAMLLQWPLARFSDRLDRRLVLLVITGLTALAGWAMALLGATSILALFSLTALFMGLAATLYPISVAVSHDYMHSDHVVGASAALLLCYGLGTIAGPLGAAAFMGRLGPAGLFGFNAVVLSGFALLLAYRLKRVTSVPVAEQIEQTGVPAAVTPILAEALPVSEATPGAVPLPAGGLDGEAANADPVQADEKVAPGA